MAKTYQLTVTTETPVPVDVLLEHIGYAIRTGFQHIGSVDITVVGQRGISHRHYLAEER